LVEAPTLDLGRVFEGRVLEHEWELLVRSPTAVTAAKTDCGCTLARLERAARSGRLPYEFGAPLEVGEHLQASVRYDTRGRRGPGVAVRPWVPIELTAEDPEAAGRARVWEARGRLGPEAPRGTYHYPLELASDEVIPHSLEDGAERSFSVAPGWRLQIVGPV